MQRPARQHYIRRASVAKTNEGYHITSTDAYGCVFSQTVKARSEIEAIAIFTINRWRRK